MHTHICSARRCATTWLSPPILWCLPRGPIKYQVNNTCDSQQRRLFRALINSVSSAGVLCFSAISMCTALLLDHLTHCAHTNSQSDRLLCERIYFVLTIIKKLTTSINIVSSSNAVVLPLDRITSIHLIVCSRLDYFVWFISLNGRNRIVLIESIAGLHAANKSKQKSRNEQKRNAHSFCSVRREMYMDAWNADGCRAKINNFC